MSSLVVIGCGLSEKSNLQVPMESSIHLGNFHRSSRSISEISIGVPFEKNLNFQTFTMCKGRYTMSNRAGPVNLGGLYENLKSLQIPSRNNVAFFKMPI